MRLKSKTTAILLIALFMISAFAVTAYAAEMYHLVQLESAPTGQEDRVVIDLPSGFTLGQLETISWSVKTKAGYPPHVDIFLDIDGSGTFVKEEDDVLVAEFAYQPYDGTGYEYTFTPNVPYGHYDHTGDTQNAFYYPTYEEFVDTFWRTGDPDSTKSVNDGTILWLNSGFFGPYEGGFFATLSDWKLGGVPEIGNPDNTIDYINSETPVLYIEIEIDNWIGPSEAYITDIKINSQCGVSLEATVRHPMTSISVSPTSIDFGELVLGESYSDSEWNIDVTNTGETLVDVTAELMDDNGFYAASIHLDNSLVVDWKLEDLASTATVDLDLIIPRDAYPGEHTAVLVFWAIEG